MEYKKNGKRILDLVLTVMVAIPVVALGVLIGSISFIAFKGKVFFLQERLGYRNKVFRVYKFATLLPEEAEGRLLLIAERETAWGKILRDYSLDELPQIMNIVKGEMSFVGPRPLLPSYKDLYTPEEAIRHEVKPGLTGLAQVNGRNSLEWKEKMGYDQQYVSTMNFQQDVMILIKTIGVVFKGQSVSYGKGPEVKEIKWQKTG